MEPPPVQASLIGCSVCGKRSVGARFWRPKEKGAGASGPGRFPGLRKAGRRRALLVAQMVNVASGTAAVPASSRKGCSVCGRRGRDEPPPGQAAPGGYLGLRKAGRRHALPAAQMVNGARGTAAIPANLLIGVKPQNGKSDVRK